MRRWVLVTVTAGGLLVPARSPAGAGEGNRPVRFHGLGPRVGVSIGPDQLVVGGHADFGDLLPRTTLLLPVIELGFGDDRTVSTIGADLLFRFRNGWGAWNPYLGGELALVLVSRDRGSGRDTHSDPGLLGVLGVGKEIGPDNRFALELKIELVDAPDLKIAALWIFGR